VELVVTVFYYRSMWGVLSNDPDTLRQYYGPLLGNSTSFVRDFAAKSFVLVIRKCSGKVFKIHMKKVITALAANAQTFLVDGKDDSSRLLCQPLEVTVAQRESTEYKVSTLKDKRVTELFEGVSLMMYYAAKGVKGRLHSKAVERLRTLWGLMFPLNSSATDLLNKEINNISAQGATGGEKKKSKSLPVAEKRATLAQLGSDTQTAVAALAKQDGEWKVYATGRVLSFAVWRLFRHVTPAHMTELWGLVLEMVSDVVRAHRALQSITDLPAQASSNLYLALSFLVELVYFGVSHSNGRGTSHKAVQNTVGDDIISAALNMTELVLSEKSQCPDNLVRRTRVLFCEVWKRHPQHVVVAARVDRILKNALPALSPEPAVTIFAQELLPALPYGVVQRHLLQPMLAVIARLSGSQDNALHRYEREAWLGTLLEVLTRIHDPREDYAAYASQIATPDYDRDKHGDGGAAVRASKGEADDDSWNASGSEGSDSEADSAAESDGPSDAESSAAEGDDQQLFSTASKTALAALVHNTENIAQLAKESVAVVLALTTSAPSAAAKKSKDKKEKKERQSLANVAESVSPVAGILAIKCLNWFLACTPQVVLEQPACQEGITAVCKELLGRLQDSAQDASGLLEWGKPIAAELLVLCGRAVELNLVSVKKAGGVQCFLRSVLLLLKRHASSVSLSWAAQTLLGNLTPLLLSEGSTASGDTSPHSVMRLLDEVERSSLLHVMATALASPSYWLRYNWLRILAHFPPARLATAEPDVTGGKVPQNQPSEIDVARVCLEAMCLSPDIRHEREYSRRVGVLEVHLRGGRMSTDFMRVVCGFCLGLLHFKFKPIWEPAVLVLVSAANLSEGEETMWPLLLKAIEATTEAAPSTVQEASASDNEAVAIRKPLGAYVPDLGHRDDGAEQMPNEVVGSELFQYRGGYSSARLVQPDARTDFETVCATVWNILRRSPNITLKRSKIVVGIFLK
jgi:hypothetical protein